MHSTSNRGTARLWPILKPEILTYLNAGNSSVRLGYYCWNRMTPKPSWNASQCTIKLWLKSGRAITFGLVNTSISSQSTFWWRSSHIILCLDESWPCPFCFLSSSLYYLLSLPWSQPFYLDSSTPQPEVLQADLNLEWTCDNIPVILIHISTHKTQKSNLLPWLNKEEHPWLIFGEPELKKPTNWTTAGQANDIASMKVFWRGRHWVWGRHQGTGTGK